MKKVLKILLILLAVVLAAAVIYVAYVMLSYNRIPDGQELTPRNPLEAEQTVQIEKEYAITTQNIGFGAYTADYTFFMDGGVES